VRYPFAVVSPLVFVVRVKHVFVEPRPSALNTTLAAFAAERRRLQHGARNYRSISAADFGDQQQTYWPPLLLSIDGTDRQTDGRTDARPSRRPCSANNAIPAASIR